MGRTIGRAGMNSDIRMSNKAEVGFGMAGLAFMGFIVLGVLVLFF